MELPFAKGRTDRPFTEIVETDGEGGSSRNAPVIAIGLSASVGELRLGNLAHVYLFGSWARGDPRRISDIDIAIGAEGPLPVALLSEIREALAESPLPYPVEVVDLAEISPGFRARILSEGIPWTA